MNFFYFKCPKEDMTDLLEQAHKCDICGQVHDYCFNLSFALTTKFQESEKDDKVGCYDCLITGEFEFWHDTEFGLLDEQGLTKVYSHNMDNSPVIDPVKLQTLRRTPQIVTYQQELWLTHCDDFMVYKGTWEPTDFYKNSSTGDARQLFLDMTDPDMNHLWDDSLDEGKEILEQWYPTYYVFECVHCGKLRGNWDCD